MTFRNLLSTAATLSYFVATVISASAPAVTIVPASNTAAGTPLFDFETKQLTGDVIARLTPDDVKLINFDDEAVNSTIEAKSAGFCKVFPGDADWPAQEIWERFNSLLDGSLIRTIPLAAPCYSTWGTYNKTKCLEIQSNFTNPWYQYGFSDFIPSPVLTL